MFVFPVLPLKWTTCERSLPNCPPLGAAEWRTSRWWTSPVCLCPSESRSAVPLCPWQRWAPSSQSGSCTPSGCCSIPPPPGGRGGANACRGHGLAWKVANNLITVTISPSQVVLPGCSPWRLWTPFDWPHWQCCPRCRSEVSGLRLLLLALRLYSNLQGGENLLEDKSAWLQQTAHW